MSTLAERLEAAIEHAKTTQNALAEAIGVERQVISMMKLGRMKGHERWPQIAERLGCPSEWLVSGQGPPPSWWGRPAETPPLPPAQLEEVLAEVRALHRLVADIAARLEDRGVIVEHLDIPAEIDHPAPELLGGDA